MQIIPRSILSVAWLAALPAIAAIGLTFMLNGEGNGRVLAASYMTGSNDPILTSLTVSAGTLSPQFSGTEVEYSVPDVPYSARVLTITAIPGPDTIVTYWHYPSGSIAELIDEDPMTDGHQVSLDVGVKVVEVSLTKGPPYTYRDYRLEITRLKPTVSIRAVSESPVYEGETIEFEIKRSAAATDALAVWVLTRELEAEVGAGHADVLADEVDGKSALHYIDGGNAVATFEVSTNGDTVWESHSKVEASIVANDVYTIDTSSGTATLLVQDDEFPTSNGVLSVSPNPVGEGSGTTTAKVTVTTIGDKKPHGEASVTVKTLDGTALAGTDYSEVDSTLKFTEEDFSEISVDENTVYSATRAIDVDITQDSVDEENETFSIRASTDSNSPITISNNGGLVSVTITDDDDSPSSGPILTNLAVNVGSLTPDFSSDMHSYTVPDVAYNNERLTITASTQSGSSIEFLDSSGNALADLDDKAAGHQVSLGIGITTVKLRVTKGNVSQDYSLAVTRAKPTVSVSPPSAKSATEGDKVEFGVTRSAAAGDSLTVNFTLAEIGLSSGVDPGDILPDTQEQTNHSITIPANDTRATVAVATSSDSVWENHSYIRLNLVDDDSYTVHSTNSSVSLLVQDDEFVASEAVLSVTPNPVGEGDEKTVATVTLTTNGVKKPHGQVSIPITTSEGTATAGSDFTTLDAALSFAEKDFSEVKVNGNSRFRASKSVDVAILQDVLDDEDETFSVALGTPSDTLVTLDRDSKTTFVTITDDEPPALTALSVNHGTITPSFSSTQTSYTVPDVGYGNIQLTLSATPEPGASVAYLDSSDSVIEDADDMTAGHQMSLGVGDFTVKVRVSEDGLAQDYTLVITRAKPVASIRALNTVPATEGDKVEFEVSRSVAAGDSLTIKFTLTEIGVSSTAEPRDILPDSQEQIHHSVTIAANDTTTTVTATTTADSVWENHSNIKLALLDNDFYTIHSSKGSASTLVQDDEFVASTAVLSVTPNPVGEGAGKTTATVTLTTKGDKAPHGRVTIPISTSEGTASAGSDFTALNASLVFAETDFSEIEVEGNARFRASKSVDVEVLQDTLDDEDETFSVALGSPSNPLVTLDAGSKTTSVTITDDELPRLTALSVSHGTLTPAFSPKLLSYTVPDVSYETHVATINVTPESGAKASFLDSSDNEYKDLDDKAEGHQVYLNIGSTTIKIRVEEDDTEQDYTVVFTRAKPTVTIRAITMGRVTEGDTLSYKVSRSSAAGDVLEVRVKIDEVDVNAGEGHGDMLPDALEGTSPLHTIEADKKSVVFSVDTVGDDAWEEHSSIEMSIKSESWYKIDDKKSTASIVVKDNDFTDSVATMTVSPNPVGEGAGKTEVIVTIATNDNRTPHGQVSIPISTSEGTATADKDYTALDESLVFEAEDFGEVGMGADRFYRASKSAVIPILDDKLDEDKETFTVTMGPASQSVVNIDLETESVVVTINDKNSAPVVAVSTMPNHPKISGRGTISLDGTSTDSDNDNLTYAWTSSPANIGSFGDTASEDTTWTAPVPLAAAQTVTLILTVTDDGVPMESTVEDVVVTVHANQSPNVEVMTEDRVVKGGETVTLSAKVSDPEMGALSFQWSGTGSFADASAKDTTWTVPLATDVVQTFTLTLTATDELGLMASDSVKVTLPAANQKPKFPSTEDGERSMDENVSVGTRVGAAVTAMDADSDSLTYSLAGVDASSFDIDGTGQITVAAGATLDYEVKSIYQVTVQVSDGRNEAGEIDHAVDASLPARITVRDVEEVGTVIFSPNTFRVGEEVRVSVQDPDNYEPSNADGVIGDADVDSVLWERSESVNGPWVQVSNAATATYIPTMDDKDKRFRVTTRYTDRRGNDKSAMGVSEWVREAPPPAPQHLSMVYSGEAGGFIVTWSEPGKDREEAITQYRVEWKLTEMPGCDPTDWQRNQGKAKSQGCQVVVNHTIVSDTTYTITGYDGNNLVGGENYSVRVSAGDNLGFGGWSKVVNARAPSSDARLSSLTIDPVGFTDFSPDVLSYFKTVGDSVAQVTVIAVAADDGAKLDFGEVVDTDHLTPYHQVALASSVNLVTIKVTAEDGLSSIVYTIALIKAISNRAYKISLSPDTAAMNWCNDISLSVRLSGHDDTLSY